MVKILKDIKDSIDEIDELMKSKKGDNLTVEMLMDKFIVTDKNLILKTDIENSSSFTRLKTIEFDMLKRGLKKSAKTLNVFTEWYIKVRVSHKRLSRKEILDAVSAIKRENSTSTIGAKIFGFGKDEKNKS